MPKYFGTDGFRGEANVGLTFNHAYRIGRFLGWYYSKDREAHEAKILVGKDTRLSCYMLEYALLSGIAASGADAYNMHVTTTPSVSYVVRTEDFDCGIMISASHNPFYDNGIKLINDKGEKMQEYVIDEIEKYLDEDKNNLPYATKENIGCTVDYAAGRNRYLGYLMSLALCSFRNMRVGLDCANGSAWMIAKNVFDALGAKTYVINNEPDGTNINTNCGSTHIQGLQALVKEKHLDVGFAFDGDADRCLCVDENGDVVDGDAILYICGKYLKNKGELADNTVVTTVMSNFGLYKAFDAAGISYEKTAVGDKYVYECMSENGYRLGGEQSGHIIFSKYAATGDGLITAIKMMEVMVLGKQTLSQLRRGFVSYPQKLTNVRVMDKVAAREDADVQAAVARITEELGDRGRILVRESGTEPLIRVMVEASDPDDCEKYVVQIVEVLRKIAHIRK